MGASVTNIADDKPRVGREGNMEPRISIITLCVNDL
jgi:hypothetical protein